MLGVGFEDGLGGAVHSRSGEDEALDWVWGDQSCAERDPPVGGATYGPDRSPVNMVKHGEEIIELRERDRRATRLAVAGAA